jgi:ABC-type antimicrobial peptide transport system permease subunit
MIIGFVALACAMSVVILVDGIVKQIILACITYALALISLYKIYPGSVIISPENYVLTGIACLAFMIAILFLGPKIKINVESGEKISTISVISPLFSIAKRNLRRRRLRFLLTLSSLTMMVMGFVALTSISEGYGLISLKFSSTSDNPTGIMLRSSTWDANVPNFLELSVAEIEWIARLEGMTSTSVKYENTPQRQPLFTIGDQPIMAVIAFDEEVEKEILPISKGLVSGRYPNSNEIALSSEATKALKLQVGDSVSLQGQSLVISGIFDDNYVSRLVDIDGRRYIPDKLVNINSEGAPPNFIQFASEPKELAIFSISTVKSIPFVGPSRIDLKTTAEAQPLLSYRIPLERGYQTWSADASGITARKLGNYVEGVGLPLIIPWGIVVLNVIVTMMSILLERRKEISILSSIGMNPSEVSLIFFFESSLLGFIAGGLGYMFGLAFYKIISYLGLTFQLYVKTSALWSLASIGIAIIAVMFGTLIALRNSTVITPSLERRWRIDDSPKQFYEPYVLSIPYTLKPGDAESFTDYLVIRLMDLENDPVKRTLGVKKVKEGKNFIVNFIYKSAYITTGNFFNRNRVIIEPENDVYRIKVESLGDAKWVHVTVSLIRQISLEWSIKE